MSKQYQYIRLENIEKYEGWDLVEVIPAKFEYHYDMAVICKEKTPKNDELQAEIERLQGEVFEKTKWISFLKDQLLKWSKDYTELKTKFETAKAEILKKPTSASAIQILAEQAVNSVDRTPQFISKIKAEAIREFAERVKERASKGFWESDAYIGIEQIDDIVKEMVGDDE